MLAEERLLEILDLKLEDLEEAVVREVKRRILDSIGVAMASISSPPAERIRALFRYYPGEARVIGGDKASPDLASFYNTLLIRYMDFNDTYLSKEPLHPSDMLGALISLGSLLRRKGRDLILAAAVGYEAGVRLCDSTSLRIKGYDHVNFLQMAASLALSKLMNLDKDKALNALSLSVVPNVALRQTRVGELSSWKAGAAADASRKATFAALASSVGIDGPREPLSGRMGFINVVAKDMDLQALKGRRASGILRTMIKKYPVEYHAQAAVEASLRLYRRVKWSQITSITVETYEAGKTILADPEKWNPVNRETADHSLPFVVSAALVSGDFWLDTYSLISDRKVRELMFKLNVVENPEYTKVYPQELPTKVIVRTSSRVIEEEVRVPEGHWAMPMSDESLDQKFLRLTGDREMLRALKELEGREVSSLV